MPRNKTRGNSIGTTASPDIEGRKNKEIPPLTPGRPGAEPEFFASAHQPDASPARELGEKSSAESGERSRESC